MAVMTPVKLDYSRLLDDEFLNRGERVRVHTVTRGAASVLSSSTSLTSLASADWKGASPRCSTALLKTAFALALMAALTFVGLLVLAHQHNVGQLQALAMPVTAVTALHDDFVLAGGAAHSGEDLEDHEHLDEIHDHVLPGDVVVEDHHILPADEPEPTRHAVVMCLPLAADKQAPSSTTAAPVTNTTASATGSASAATASAFPLQLSRHQRDVVQSVTEYLSATARCHIVVLRGVDDEDAVDQAAASSTAASSTSNALPAATRRHEGIFGKFKHTGCGAWSSEDEDDGGAEHGGSLALPGGKVVPVVLWDAAALFARSPLAEVWHGLHGRRAQGVARGASRASPRASAASELLDMAARLQLLWRYGGVSVDLQSSADQVLKALSAFNRTDSSHVYLETTRGALIAAPQTCNAIVFDLIQAVAKQTRQGASPSARAYHDDDDDDGDVKVFDGVLNDYCRSKRTPRQLADESTTAPTTTALNSTASNTTTSAPNPAASNTTATAATAAASNTPTSVPNPTAPNTTTTAASATAPDTTRPRLLARIKGAAAFGRLRPGPPASTTTPRPDPQDIRLDTTQCRGNLVAISLP